jgi:amino acid adenylation domain-containing protein
LKINVLEYFEETVKRYREKVAIREMDSELTFGELRNRALAVGAAIAERSTDRCGPVAVFLPKSGNAIAAFFGALYSGNFYAPMDVKSPPKRIEAILRNADPECIISSRALKGAIPEPFAGRVLVIEEILEKADGDGAEGTKRYVKRLDIDPIYMIYTSGSTGVPKGVLVSHRGVIDYIEWAIGCYDISSSEVIGSQSPLFFDNSTLDLYLMAFAGAELAIIPESHFAFPQRLLEFIDQRGISLIFWVPSLLINIANMDLLSRARLPRLKKVLFAGEVMPNKQLNYWRQWHPEARYSNLYGPTEITVDCTYYDVEGDFADDAPLPIGVPCRNSDILILDEDNREAGTGKNGELCVRGCSLALGYYRDWEKTNAAFVQNPLNPDYPDRIYRTGDLVFRNEKGLIIFVGRKDSQIKHLGYRIELGEIETAIRGIQGIENCCVIYDKGRSEICLFYQAESELQPAQLRTSLSASLPKYMIPTNLCYYKSLPMTPNGKIDRQKLQEALKDA